MSHERLRTVVQITDRLSVAQFGLKYLSDFLLEVKYRKNLVATFFHFYKDLLITVFGEDKVNRVCRSLGGRTRESERNICNL